MLPTTIRSRPSAEDYVSLEEYESQTPESFADSKPVMHFQLSGAKATIPKSQGGSLAIFPADGEAEAASSSDDGENKNLIAQPVDVYANSQYVFLKRNSASHSC